MNVQLMPVTDENWQACCELNVREDQQNLICSNALALAECSVRPGNAALAVYDGMKTLVGLIVYLRNAVLDGYEIHRFMIDQRYQGRGMGRHALVAVLRRLRTAPDAGQYAYIMFLPENTVAESLYRTIGFQDTGKMVGFERLFRISFTEIRK